MRMLKLMLCLLAFAGNARAVEDGLYSISATPTSTPIDTLYNGRVFLDKVLLEKADEVRLVSNANDNAWYILFLKFKLGHFPSGRGIALVLNNKCVAAIGYGGGDSERNYSMYIPHGDTVVRAATFFKILAQDRNHPGHQFTAKFIAEKSGYALGTPVKIALQIRNCGNKPFTIQQPTMARLLDAFSFTAYIPNGNEAAKAIPNKPYHLPVAYSYMFGEARIAPGDIKSIPVDLNHFLLITEKGDYFVRGTYALEILDPDPAAQGQVLWDDFATAEFEVEIK